MNDLPYYCKLALHPRQMTLLVLFLVFVIEAAIMLALPARLSETIGPLGVAATDSFLLTVLLVPCLWWVIVKPLRRIADCRQHLLDWALSGEERKARQLARDLHDGIGQIAAAMNIGLASIEANSTEPGIIEQAGKLREVGRQLHESIRTLARGLRPSVLDDIGLGPAISHYTQETAAAFAIPITTNASDLDKVRLPEAIETAVFRVVQEAVSNAVRHAHPQRIDLDILLTDHNIELSVSDDGCGFEPEDILDCRSQDKPFGLISIRERVHLLGGTALLTSRRGRGTQISASIPLLSKPLPHA
ncbi:hypothetical protein GC163_20265 [bacterium]|nr:hypothetical protein [bacterium]